MEWTQYKHQKHPRLQFEQNKTDGPSLYNSIHDINSWAGMNTTPRCNCLEIVCDPVMINLSSVHILSVSKSPTGEETSLSRMER
jgi:hypothetical protein